MLTRLHLKNFKGWEETPAIRLAPITVFFGSNSSGKTSLLQSMLLLKQTAESSDRSRVLHTGDDRTLVDLGTVSDVMFGHDLERALETTLAWTLPEPLEVPGARPEWLQFTVRVRLTSAGQPYVELARYHSDELDVVMERRSDDAGYDLKSTPSLRRSQGRPGTIPAPVRFYGFPDEVRNYFQKAGWLTDLALALERQLARIQYVGPLRLYARRSYGWSGERPDNVGVFGERSVPALLAAQAEDLRVPRGEGRGRRYEAFLEVIARWLKELGMIDSFQVERISERRKEYEVRVRSSPQSAEVLITDVGVGVSQVLPVLVQAFYAAPGSTVLFEQPEIHLHPRVQASLADVLIEASTRCGVQFIVESHSEHFLRRLQRRVAEWEIKEGAIPRDHVALYVCSVDKGRSEVEALQVDELGNISNWPKDFFGDEMGDLAAMTEAAIKRQKRR
jgi:predicted ATPase